MYVGGLMVIIFRNISCRVSDLDVYGEDIEFGFFKFFSVRFIFFGVVIDLCIGFVSYFRNFKLVFVYICYLK